MSFYICLTGLLQFSILEFRRERKCISSLLARCRNKGKALDLPCGTGRLTPLLSKAAFHTFAADSSSFMIDKTVRYIKSQGCDVSEEDCFVVDALESKFPDNMFDLVLCNRLMHHFNYKTDRIKLLNELKRISKRYIIVSFFWSLSLDTFIFNLKNYIRRKTPLDRIPIRLSEITREIKCVGLKVVKLKPVRPLVSKQTYLLLEKTRTQAIHSQPGVQCLSELQAIEVPMLSAHQVCPLQKPHGGREHPQKGPQVSVLPLQ